ncbi:MAG: shikimate dehydrogenase [Gemmatimonadetes bacterium]|nr:MAG: shikimate dehydrogenase [Gemmatimonadota bacterium]
MSTATPAPSSRRSSPRRWSASSRRPGVEISASTRLLGVIGDPIAHSLSPTMYNAAFRALGLDAVYVALPTPAAALSSLLSALVGIGAAGNVTVPHKEAVERCCARKTDLCARVGACNTFWTEQGQLVGDNTDVAGVLSALRALGGDGAGRWLVLGTGGSARAVAVAAAEAKAELQVRSRDPERARAFARWAEGAGASAHAARVPVATEIVINATPLGLEDRDPLPLAAEEMRDITAALDLVYAPGETRWVRLLRARGIAAADGREVLVRQGAAAFGRFFPGQPAPVEVMRAAVNRALRA